MTLIQWAHSDPVGLRQRYESALARCDSHQWDVDSVQLRGGDLRALVMGTCLIANRTYDANEYTQTEVLLVDYPNKPENWPTLEHYNACAALNNTLIALAEGGKPKFDNFVTYGAEQPHQIGVEGWPILIAKIAAHAIWAFAACYIAQAYEPTLDRLLSRADAGHKMLAAQADLLRTVETHADKEKALGATIPYSAEEKQVINTLVNTQQTFANKEDPPKPAGSSFASMGVAGIAVLGLVAYFALKGK